MAGTVPLGGMGLVADPREGRRSVSEATGSYPNRVLKTLHDPKVKFEEYLHFAGHSRKEEEQLYGPGSIYRSTRGPVSHFLVHTIARRESIVREPEPRRLSIIEAMVSGKDGAFGGKEKAASEEADTAVPSEGADTAVPSEEADTAVPSDRLEITEQEWLTASRAARTATWGAIFYLIATDVLGPFSTGWAFSQMGWGPAIALYTVFGFLSWYSGYLLWQMFLNMDSDRYPMKDFGDFGFRVYGPWARHLCNVLQSFQFLFNVALIIISSGQSISQMSKGTLCFVVCVLISAIAGCIVGQIRTLARFGWLASIAVFLNLFVIFASMGIMATSTPNYLTIASAFPSILPDVNDPAPIHTSGGSPPGYSFLDNVNGLMQAVFSFGGATLFPNLMAEMRRPLDFWKGLLCGEIFIYLCYLVYGAVCYGLQGQYVFNPSYQGINPYDWQTVFNALELVTGLIAACLYGNIGIKVLYNNIGRDLFRFPPLESKKGKWIWVASVPIYWMLAFVIGSAIPQVALFSAFVAAVCILQFSYTFPPILMVGYTVQHDAILVGETFDPNTGRVERKDHGIRRWLRGYRKQLLLNVLNTIYFLGSVVTAILGIYSAISGMHQAYSTNPNVSSFSCKSPVNG